MTRSEQHGKKIQDLSKTYPELIQDDGQVYARPVAALMAAISIGPCSGFNR